MQSEEAIKKAVGQGNTKRVAADMGISNETLYKYQDGSLANPVQRVEELTRLTGSNTMVKYLCGKAGGYFIEGIKADDMGDFAVIPNVAKEFGEMLTALSDGLLDGKVTYNELEDIKSEFADVVSVMHNFFNTVENGLL